MASLAAKDAINLLVGDLSTVLPGVVHLGTQLEVARQSTSIELAGFHSSLNGAARLALMTAIAESALRSQLLDIAEGAVDIRRFQPEFAHAGCIDENPPAGKQNRLAMGGGVSPLTVITKSAGAQNLFTNERIHQSRLADTRRADEGDGALIIDERRHRFHALLLQRGGDEHIDTDRDAGDVLQLGVQILCQIRFGKHHHRFGTAIPHQCEVALQATEIEILVQCHADEHHIDIRGNELPLLGGSSRLANNDAGARENLLNHTEVIVSSNHHPIADSGEGGDIFRVVEQFARDHSGSLATFSDNGVLTALLCDNAGKIEIWM